MIRICENYGEVIVSCTDESAILSYGRRNQDNVLALLTRDTSFLVFDDKFEFWSMSYLLVREIKVAKFDRQAIKNVFGLNSTQMQLLCAVSQFEYDGKRRIFGNANLLWGCTPYVKRQKCGANGYDISQLTGNFTAEQVESISKTLEEMEQMNNAGSVIDDVCIESIEDLKKTDPNFKWSLQFCKKKMYFAYKLMTEPMTIPKDLLFIDLREPDGAEFVALVVNITLKLCGILFKDVVLDKRPKTRSAAAVSNGAISPTEKDIIYPPSKPLENDTDFRLTYENK